MLLHPTSRALHISWAGVIILFLGIVLQRGDITTYGAALLMGITVARSWSKISVARARAAGFEMLWRGHHSTTHCKTHQPQWLTLQLRNRDSLPTRFEKLNVLAASQIKIEPEVISGEIPAQSSIDIRIKVTPLQLGIHGIFGIRLATLRAPGLYEIPLAFTNPHVLQVEPSRDPKIHLRYLQNSRARNSTAGYSTRGGNEGQDMREIREKQPSDSIKHIAWKPSARRGKLLVIDREDESRERVWIIVDCSYEFFMIHGASSHINQQAERARMLCHQHLQRGDLVGLALLGARKLFELQPGRGPRHRSLLESAFTFELHTLDSDRSAWDAHDVALKAREFSRQFEPALKGSRDSTEKNERKTIQKLLNKAPLKLKPPFSKQASDTELRQLLLSFGIQSPPKEGQERQTTELQVTQQLNQIAKSRPRNHIVHLLARLPQPQDQPPYFQVLSLLKRNRISVILHPLNRIEQTELSFADKVEDELREQRAQIQKKESVAQLRARGVKTIIGRGPLL